MLLALLALTLPPPTSVPIQTPAKLARLPDLDLRASDGPPSPFENLSEFALLGADCVAFTRWNTTTLTICDTHGKVLREVPSIEHIRHLYGVGKSRVLIATDPVEHTDGKRCALWVAGLQLDSVQPFAEFNAERIEAVTVLPDLSCAAIVDSPNATGTERPSLIFFASSGTKRFSLELPYMQSGHEMFTTADGHIAVVEKGKPCRIVRFDEDGRTLGWVELDLPDPTATIEAAVPIPNGGWFAQVWRAGSRRDEYVPASYRFDEHGDNAQYASVRWADGLPVRSGWFHGPDHTPWTYDGYAFSRVGLDGIATVQFGESRDAERLRSAWLVRTAPDGTIYAFAGRDSALHVFGPDGVKRKRIVPSGYIGQAGFRTQHEVGRFDPELQWLAEPWLGPPRHERHFDVHRDQRDEWQVRVVDSSGSIVRVLARPTECVAQGLPIASETAGDGSVAIVWKEGLAGNAPPVAACYDQDGNLVRSFALPAAAKRTSVVAWNGDRLAAVDDLHAWVFDARGKPVADGWLSGVTEYSNRAWTCGNAPDISLRADLAADGHELRLRFGPECLVLERYALP